MKTYSNVTFFWDTLFVCNEFEYFSNKEYHCKVTKHVNMPSKILIRDNIKHN